MIHIVNSYWKAVRGLIIKVCVWVWVLILMSYLHSYWLDIQFLGQSKAVSWCKVWRSGESFFQLCPLINVETSALSFLLRHSNESILSFHVWIFVYKKKNSNSPALLWVFKWKLNRCTCNGKERRRGPVVRAPDFKSGGPGFKSRLGQLVKKPAGLPPASWDF